MHKHWPKLAVVVAVGALSSISLSPKLAEAAKACSVDSLDGDYLGNISGSNASVGPFALQALVSLNGDGTGSVVTGTVTTETSPPVTFTSDVTYTVNSDCTGTLTSVRSTGQTTHYNIAVVDKGDEFFALATDTGVVATGTFKASR